MERLRRLVPAFVFLTALWMFVTLPASPVRAADLREAPVTPLPDIHLSFGSGTPAPSQVAVTVELLLLLTVLSLAPAILVMMTS
ncbi:MAG: flagellar biosynthetic protein FliP, partial [Nitrospirae bacterium]|nr:flagellar biosynthetic protein FliP [Nitrospirota bacterium]